MIQIRFCEDHNTYYVSDAHNPAEAEAHLKCKKTWELQWREVTYYLNKLRTLRELFNKLRIELL